MVDKSVAPHEISLLFPVSGLGLSHIITSVLLERPGLREATAAAYAAVQLHSCVDLHVSLDLIGLPEPAVTHSALVGPLSSVDH